jgi:hypothetical protein
MYYCLLYFRSTRLGAMPVSSPIACRFINLLEFLALRYEPTTYSSPQGSISMRTMIEFLNVYNLS